MADIETPVWRNKHKIGNIMSRLNKHAEGEIEMTSTQIQAAKLYLDKTLPSLTSTKIAGDPEGSAIKVESKVTTLTPEQSEDLFIAAALKGMVKDV